MNRSYSLYVLQQLDSELDRAQKRIQDIELILQDTSAIEVTQETHQRLEKIHAEKSKLLKKAEEEVASQNLKLDQNQKKLYGGAITNPKELEDLQQESTALNNYLQVLEERQLEAMIAADQSRTALEAAADNLQEIRQATAAKHAELKNERNTLVTKINQISEKRNKYLESEELPDLAAYESLRERSGGIAVTIMTESSCGACGANIPSAIEQSAKSPTKLAFCPTCKRILHPG